MNIAYHLTQQRQPIQLQNLTPPNITVAASNVLNTKLTKISQRVDLGQSPVTVDTEHIPAYESSEHQKSIDIPVLVIGMDMNYDGPSKQTTLLRLTIKTDFEAYPQSHKIALFDPTEDVFFHWSFHCSPFTYKTLSKQMKWSIDSTQFQKQFQNFGDLIKRCADDVVALPDRFRATLQVMDKIGILTFTEIVNQYRKIELIKLDFIPSSFSDIKQDVSDFTKSVREEHEKSKQELIQVLEQVSTHQPAILLHSNGLFDSLEPFQPDEWQKAQDRLAYRDGISIEEHLERTKQFIAETETKETQFELVLSKPMSVELKENDQSLKTEIPCYQIRITDPTDAFFLFKSIDITPDRFHKMTSFIDPVKIDDLHPRRGISKSWGLQTSKQVGFHDPTGKRGVVGVIAHDYMSGVMTNPNRHKAHLNITTPPRNSKYPLPIEPEPHQPPFKNAKLVFTEFVLYQHKPSLEIEFFSCDFGEMTRGIRKQVQEMRYQTLQSKMKLESILKMVNKRNSALYSLLQKPRVKKTTEVEVKGEQFGYKWKEELPSPEVRPKRDYVVVPQRDVVMKIPIATGPLHKRVEQKMYTHKARDAWFRNSTNPSKAVHEHEKPTMDNSRKESLFMR